MIPITRPWLGAEEAAAVNEVLASGWVAQGPKVAAFEASVAAALGAGEGVATTSCTTALHLALHALGVGPGDEVVVPSLSFIATTNAPRYAGARPVFADVDLETQNITAETLERALSPATRAVIVVHQAGMPADLDAIEALCKPRGVTVVEDAACAIGSTYRGLPVGARNLVALSFHPRKLITTGEGGMLLTGDGRLARRLRRLREHGMAVSAHERHASRTVVVEAYEELGFNYRMTDLQAAIGLVQLGKLDAIVARRRALAARYSELLGDVPGLSLPADPPYGTTNYQSYVVQLDDDLPLQRDVVMQELLDRGIATRRGIMAAHLEPSCAALPAPALPVTERLTRRSLILPLFHGMDTKDVERVAEALATAVAHCAVEGPPWR
ncbi:DegT/DnrJ/EryC1/StrS family aminotransferase [Candidatus Solirubrobacter pratensis]|uniref:DegT/DnrJ/EryC1/StrS family aminotransferase n=1 Tax=Candidatus Solirubrobacter pratensis TaxID=1298857 RepID=UPI000687939A